ncbi:MAG TPA: isoleucine--tRNA ligase [Chlamydiales bacterium]|nr:isoleucine--tRNA ligase [Chlamydiales bacterium]
MFEIRQDESFPEREERVLRFWRENHIFKKSLEERKGKPLFSFYDGPPFATGLPHYGHLLAGTIKDVIPRYKTMKGFYVPRRFGWDCHGLPIENEIEKAKELSGAASIEKFGIANFNEECRSIVLRYTEEWKETVDRMGRWVDFSETYKTMDPTYMESVWWVFKQLYERGLVYEGYKVMPYSMKLGTPISNFEANLNYQEVDDPSLTVKFAVLDEPNTYFLAWTTTPWTLPSNLALMVGPEMEYVKIEHKDEIYYIAKSRLSAYFEEYKILETVLGKQLEGKRYEPLFPFFKDVEEAFRVILEPSVSAEEGTGIVQSAPAFGETDFFACKNAGIEAVVCPIDNNGRFTKEVPPYEGILVKDADKEIIRHLKKEGKVFQHTQIRHRYPFCWRSDTPLIYKAVKTWFIRVEAIKDKLLESNSKIHWMPEHIKDGRFGKWLMSARDWAFSRNRYWGTPIPIWQSEDGEVHVIGSVKELEERTKSQIVDLHRHFIDPLTFTLNGKTFKRIPEVFDCWFESGSMPYAQNHYPFENKEKTEKSFPADFIAEGLDQTRGWFYTLTVLATALFSRPAFKNVIVNGIILAEDGMKMSKRLKNYPEPGYIIQRFGADAIRLYMLDSTAVKAEDMRFSERGVELIVRQILIPLWNSYVFLATYANIYHFKPAKNLASPKALIDRWILSLLNKLILEVDSGLAGYDLNRAVGPFVGFIDQLTNWYIRRSRGRFWADEDTPDRREAFQTLYTVMFTLVKIAAPFIPFISDAIYAELRTENDPLSVHLCSFPEYHEERRDLELELEMEYSQRAVSLGHALRKEHKLKVRQPLPRAHIAVSSPDVLQALQKQKHLIAEELNVKDVDLHQDERQFVQVNIVPNFRVLGKKIGKLMPKMQKHMQDLDRKAIDVLVQGQPLKITLEGETFELTSEDVAVQRIVKEGIAAGNDRELVVALETHLTPELLLEGLAREIVNKINTMRRDMNFEVTDRIKVTMQTTDRVKSCIEEYNDYISHEILAPEIIFGPVEGESWDLNGEQAIIKIEKLKEKNK